MRELNAVLLKRNLQIKTLVERVARLEAAVKQSNHYLFEFMMRAKGQPCQYEDLKALIDHADTLLSKHRRIRGLYD